MAATDMKPIRAKRPELCQIFGKATGAGAANLTSLVGPGIASINYNAATGKIQVTLSDKWNELVFVGGTVIDPTAPGDWEVVVESETVSSTKLINLAIFKGGLLADLTSDEKLLLHIVVSNSARVH